MKARILIILAAALVLCFHLQAQSDNSIHVKSFPGLTVGQKVAAAQLTCGPSPCILILDSSLASYPTGTIPALCGNCTLLDYRQGVPGSAASGIFNAMNYGAKPDGATDSAGAINAAISAANSAGGGTVLLPGCAPFAIYSQVTILSGVSLVSNCSTGLSPSTSGAPGFPYDAMGWLYVDFGAGSTSTPAVLMEANSHISGFGFYYPGQVAPTASTPIQFGYSIASDTGASNLDNIFIDHIFLLNSYLGINMTKAGRFTLDWIYGQPISTGIYVDQIYDVARPSHVHFWPFYTSPGQGLYNWILANGTAFAINRVDGLQAYGWFAYGYNYCGKFSDAGNGGAWASFVSLECDTTNHPVYISAMNHLSFMASILNSGAASNPDVEATAAVSGGNLSITGGTLQGAASVGVLVDSNSGTFDLSGVTFDMVSDPILYLPILVSGTATVHSAGNIGPNLSGLTPWGGSNLVLDGVPMLPATNSVSPSNFNMATFTGSVPNSWSAPSGSSFFAQTTGGVVATLAPGGGGSQVLQTLQYTVSAPLTTANVPYVLTFNYATTATSPSFRFAVAVENSIGSTVVYSSPAGPLITNGNTIKATIPLLLNGVNNITFLFAAYGTVSGTVTVTNIGLYQPPFTLSQLGMLQNFMSNPNGTAAALPAIPQVGTPTAGNASCIKSAGPPVVIGYCSSVVAAGGTCTCN